jgi:hypothetical protein
MKIRMLAIGVVVVGELLVCGWLNTKSATSHASPGVDASWQDYSARLTIQSNAGNLNWPNGGDMAVVAFGWGEQRPFPLQIAVDSAAAPFFKPGTTTALTIQKRKDVFSPLLQELFNQHQSIESLMFTISSPGRTPQTYVLYDVRIASMRDVGQIVTDSPDTEELVFAFNRMTLPGQ